MYQDKNKVIHQLTDNIRTIKEFNSFRQEWFEYYEVYLDNRWIGKCYSLQKAKYVLNNSDLYV